MTTTTGRTLEPYRTVLLSTPMGISDHIEPSDQQTDWVAPRLVPLSALHQAEAGTSTFMIESGICDIFYAPAS